MNVIKRTGRVHFLKTWPEPFEAVASGVKPFEIRRNDRHYRVGDLLVLREYDLGTETYSGQHVARLVTYVSSGRHGLPPGLCVLGMVEDMVPCHPSYFSEGTVENLEAHVEAMRARWNSPRRGESS